LTAGALAGAAVPAGGAAAPKPVTVAPRAQGAAVAHLPTLHNRCKRSKIDVPACGVLWGMYLPPAPAKPQWRGHYPSVERKIGRRLDIIKRYVDWRHGIKFPDASDRKLAAGGKRILDFSWNSINYKTRQSISWKSIASGRWDASVILPEARELKKFHHKVFLDFDHEPDSYIHAGLGTPAQFVAAYRHIYRVMRRAGVRNVVWTWVVTGFLGNEKKIEASYPGSKYVDWIGYDPYNFGACQAAPWTSSMQIIAPFYRWLRDRPSMKHKPILLAEYASVLGARAGSWYASIAHTLRRLPRIKAVMQWSAQTSSVCDFRLTNSAQALAGFTKASHSAYILGRAG